MYCHGISVIKQGSASSEAERSLCKISLQGTCVRLVAGKFLAEAIYHKTSSTNAQHQFLQNKIALKSCHLPKAACKHYLS